MASIEKRGKNSYRLVVETGYSADGKRIKRSKTIKASGIREAERELAKFQVEVEAGEYIAPEKMNFSKFLEEWTSKYGEKHLDPNTLKTYSHMLQNHITPVFGGKRLDEIKPIHIVSFLKSLEQDGTRKDGKSGGLSSTSIRFVHRVLKDIMERAVEWRIIKLNPVSAIKRPKLSKTNVDVYDEQEVSMLLEALQKEPLHWRLLITLAITTGLRRGELLGLEWKHVNFETGAINVEQALSYTNGQHIFKTPKTKSSVRKVSLPEALLEDLKCYYADSLLAKEQLGDEWKGGSHFLVFSSWNGNPFYHTVPGTWFRRFLKRTNLKRIRFHDLRHTSATLLINLGVHAKTIAGRLGHADIRTTMNVYGHALQTADQLAANTLNSLLTPQSKTSESNGA